MGRIKVITNSAQDGGIKIGKLNLKNLEIDIDGSELDPVKLWGFLAGNVVHNSVCRGLKGDPWRNEKLVGEVAKELYLRAYREGVQAALNEAERQGILKK